MKPAPITAVLAVAVLGLAGLAFAADGGSTVVPSAQDVEARLQRVSAVHLGAGPWAVAGFRMGEFVGREWQVSLPSRDVSVEHRSPNEVQYACVIDGASAATGASVGKLSLKHVEAPLTLMETTFRHAPTGRVITLRLTESFKKRYLNVPVDQLRTAGAEVMRLPDAEIFTVSSRAERK